MEPYGEQVKLTDYSAAQIEKLKSSGVNLTPEHILTIAAIGRLVESPSARLDCARGRPVVISGVSLYPLTLAASDWFTRHQKAMGDYCLHALAYAMAHGREPLPEINVARVVKQWASTLKCRLKELDVACQQVLAQDAQPESSNNNKDSMTIGDLSMTMTSICGGSPDVWEYQCSMRYVNELLSHKLAVMAEQDPAKGRRMEHEKAMAEYVWKVKHGEA